MLKSGDPAPAWKAFDQNGNEHSSSEYSGKRYILYFYPKDDTPGCTAEACGFRDQFSELSKKVAIVGVSADSSESHKKFEAKYRLPFTLLSDPNRQLIAAYGTDGTALPKRTSFLIGPTGMIEKIYQGFDAALHAGQVQADLDALSM